MPVHALDFIVKYKWGSVFMKQFLKDQKITYNLMSFTGYKALILFNLLTEGPKSYNEICDYFMNHPYLREKISIDTLRVYINSLKRVGCEVKRFRGEDKESRYVILSHPFELKITPEQMQSIIKIYKSLVKNIDIKELLSLENFFEKIYSYIKNDEFLSNIRKVSMLNGIDKHLLTNLIGCCDKKDQIVITYNSPNSGKKNIEFRLLNEKSENINQGDKIKFRVLDNDNLYILASVVEKFVFNNIDELWKHKEILSNNVLGYTKEELMSAFYDIFGKEKVINSKIVGIKFNIVK